MQQFNGKALGITAGLCAVALVAAFPALAQQNPPANADVVPPGTTQAAPPVPGGGPAVRGEGAKKALVITNLNLRSGPGTDSQIVTVIPGGSTVNINNCSGEWCSVEWNGHDGYAVARNLDTGDGRHAQVPRRRAPVEYGGEEDYVEGAPVYYGPGPYYGYYYGGPYYYGPRFYYGGGWGGRRWR